VAPNRDTTRQKVEKDTKIVTVGGAQTIREKKKKKNFEQFLSKCTGLPPQPIRRLSARIRGSRRGGGESVEKERSAGSAAQREGGGRNSLKGRDGRQKDQVGGGSSISRKSNLKMGEGRRARGL